MVVERLSKKTIKSYSSMKNFQFSSVQFFQYHPKEPNALLGHEERGFKAT